MALIVGYHTITTQLPIAPAAEITSNPITEGMGVEFRTVSGGESQIQLKQTSGSFTFGIAGDSATSTGPNNAYGSSVVVSPAGLTRGTQSRVSDFFNETVGSGKITVYTGIGEFYTDMFVSGSYTPGTALYVSQTSGATRGRLTTTSTNNGNVVGRVIDGPRAYPSGVPGVDDAGVAGVTSSVNGSLSLGNFLRFYMNIQP